MTLLLVYITSALILSFLCSIMEAVILCITPAYVEQTRAKNPKLWIILNKIKKDIDTPLAAILSLNTLAHTIGAAGAGAQAAHIFGDKYLGVISGILTLLILIFSEIIPKTLGAVHWKKLTPYIVVLLRITYIVMYPFVILSKFITRMLTKGKKQEAIDKGEFQALMEMAVRQGLLDRNESYILKNLLRFRQLSVSEVMTPRTVVMAFDENTTVDEVLKEDPDLPFSRIPIYRDDIDSITGFVLKNEMLLKALAGERNAPLKEIRRDIPAFPENLSIITCFNKLVADGNHISLLVDEYGGTAGIATLEDIIETLTGFEIVDEKDEVTDMQKLAKKKWAHRIKSGDEHK